MRSVERASVDVRRQHAAEAAELERAALERLHARRLAAKEAVLVQDGTGRWTVVKLRKLDASSRQLLLDRVYCRSEDEGLGFFARVRERLDRAGVPESTVEVRFKNLVVRGTQLVRTAGPTQQPGALARLQALSPFHAQQRTRKWNILDGVSGVLKPGRITLLLGTPGSGRSVLMKALARRLGQEKTLKATYDELTYNGQSLDQIVPERTAMYISQLDQHYGELTVRQTLEFSARVQGSRRELLEVLEEQEQKLGIQPDPNIHGYMAALAASGKKSLAVDIMLRTLGLDICADTLVGNHMIRGISGGQKKRVTAGEMMVGPSKVLFADEISTGLDSNTTHDVVLALRTVARYTHATQLVALLQPSPETYDLFDDIMVLSAGKIIFHGPRELVLPFFGGLGFECPVRKGIAEFLQEVPTVADQRRYWAGEPADYRYIGAQEISDEFFETTEPGREAVLELGVPFDVAAAGTEAAAHASWALVNTRYGASLLELTRACLRRGLWQLRGNFDMHMGRLIQTAILAFVAGTLFLQEDKGLQGQAGTDGQLSPNVPASITSANNFLGVLFFTIITFMVASFPDSALLVESLPVWYKHRAAQFYPAFCFALQNVAMRLPWVFVESWVWTLMVYFMVGFVVSARLLAFWAIVFAIGCFSLTLFLACGSLMRKVPAASAIQASLLLFFINTCGFVINKAQVPGGWNAVYWANPLQYFMSGLAVNELTSPDWSDELPGGSTTIGQLTLATRGMPQSYGYVWLAIFVWGGAACCINFAACVFFLTYLSAPKDPVVLSEEAFAMQHRSRSGANLLTLAGKAAGKGPSPRSLELATAQGKAAANGKPAVPNRAAAAYCEAASNGSDLDDPELGSTGQRRAASALPFKPLVMTFSDVKYSVPFPKDAVRDESNTGEGEHAGALLLLRGISGSFRPGVLTALMGASGAGKTTLMDVLAGRKTGGTITGDIRVNGFPKVHQTFARVMGYCEQTDIHVPFTTVHEALQLSARLRLPSHIAKQADKTEAFVQEIMDLIELTPIKDSAVGLPGSGLSVEQRKRLTIAVELVANPSIVFMDEPTSGLDARGAGLVMRAVKSTVNTGRTVVCTIHQPSLEIFEAFNELLLLKRGGETIFDGPVGQDASALIDYFSSIKGVPAIKPRINPANWMLEVSSPEAEKRLGVDFAQLFVGSEQAEAAAAMVEKYSVPPEGEVPLRIQDLNVVSQLVQFKELTVRNSRELVRDFSYNGIRFVLTLAVAIIFSTLFANQGQNTGTFAGVLNVAGAMYSASVFVSISFCMMCQDSLVLRRTVYYREHAASTYGVVPFWAAELAAEVPWVVLYAMLYSVITYFSIGFIADADKFFWFFLMTCLALLSFLSFGMMSVHITPGLEISNAFAGFIFALFNLTCGFMKPQPNIPKGWIWLYWSNPVSYTLYGLVANQLGDVTTLTEVPSGGPEPVLVPVNQFVEDYFGFTKSWEGYTVLLQICFIIVFRLIALLALKKLNFQTR